MGICAINIKAEIKKKYFKAPSELIRSLTDEINPHATTPIPRAESIINIVVNTTILKHPPEII